MTHAYSESYLNNAKDRLSSFFDYAINDCKLKPDWITALFINTGYAEQFERGNPAYVAGMSGVELARAVITKAYGPKGCQHQPTQRTAPLNIGPVGQLQSTNGLLAVVSRISLSAFHFPRSLGCIPFTTRWTLQVSSIPWRNSIKQRKVIPT